jgi:hypothetical protein
VFADRQDGHYVEPSFGFVAAARPARQGAGQAPRRSWSSATYIVDVRADVRTGRTQFAHGAEIEWHAGARGSFVVINEGTNKAGFRLCAWCGWGVSAATRWPREHRHLIKGTTCEGPYEVRSLAHSYETDFVEIDFGALVPSTASPTTIRSTAYALVEGAATALEISRDDIDATVHRGVDGDTVVVFDTTPGGAGNALRIADHLSDVVTAAVARISRCECGVETSCYGCLRAYRNERFHAELSRGAALELLGPLVPGVQRR